MQRFSSVPSSAEEGAAGVAPAISEFSSQMGVSKRYSEDPEVSLSLLDVQETDSKASKWTDEKHGLYLKSMEASFVNDLYSSMDLLDWCPNEGGSSGPEASSQKHNSKGTPTPSGQFKVFRDGSWARINFRNETTIRVKKVGGPSIIWKSPWIQRYKSSNRKGTRISPTIRERASLATDSHLQLDREDSIGSNAEMTDQNFVDEVSKEEKSSRIRRKKCRKISKAASSGNDQVVPFGKLSLIDVANGQGSSKE